MTGTSDVLIERQALQTLSKKGTVKVKGSIATGSWGGDELRSTISQYLSATTRSTQAENKS